METKRGTNANSLNNLRRFVKGESGNPGGVSKAVRQVRDMCKALHPDCANALKRIINGEDDRAALEAVKIVYSRSIGKEREAEQLLRNKANISDIPSVMPDPETLSDAQLTRIMQIMREPLS